MAASGRSGTRLAVTRGSELEAELALTRPRRCASAPQRRDAGIAIARLILSEHTGRAFAARPRWLGGNRLRARGVCCGGGFSGDRWRIRPARPCWTGRGSGPRRCFGHCGRRGFGAGGGLWFSRASHAGCRSQRGNHNEQCSFWRHDRVVAPRLPLDNSNPGIRLHVWLRAPGELASRAIQLPHERSKSAARSLSRPKGFAKKAAPDCSSTRAALGSGA